MSEETFDRSFFVQQGKRGGKTRAENMTDAERREASRKAALARWAEKKKAGKKRDR